MGLLKTRPGPTDIIYIVVNKIFSQSFVEAFKFNSI